MKFFIDTHDRASHTFPEAALTKEQFAGFYDAYQQACREEGVVSLRIHVGLEPGRAFCFTMAPDADAVRRVHDRLGLPFESIVEVQTVSPSDLG